MRDAFTTNTFKKITLASPTLIKSIVGSHPNAFLASKFQLLPFGCKRFVNDRLLYCYPNKRSIALNYKIRRCIEEEFGKGAVGDFVEPKVARFIDEIGSALHYEYSVKSDGTIEMEFEKIPPEYKLDNDVLNISVFNLCHRLKESNNKSINDDKIAIRIIDLMFNVYSLSFLLNEADRLVSSNPLAPHGNHNVIHLSKGTFQAKQLIFAAVFRIRAAWDKLMFNLVSEFFGVKFGKRDGYFKKLEALCDSGGPLEMDDHSNLHVLINMARSIDGLRNLRDDELHNYGVSIHEMYEESSLSERWDQVIAESIKIREATALGLSLLTGHEQTIFARTPFIEIDLRNN